MSKPANPKMIGAFVLGAIALLVVGIAAFGGAKLFETTHRYVMFFQGSVKGLRVGAPVTWRGVPIGQVQDIDLLFNPEKLRFYLQVVVEIVEGSAKEIGDEATVDNPEDEILALIKKGLRGQLVQQSFVTGQLGVEFGFFPETEPKIFGLNPDLQEIPTVPSTFQKIEVAIKTIVQKLEEVDVKQIVADLEATVSAARELVASPELKAVIVEADATLQGTRELIDGINSRFKPLADNIDSAAIRANRTLQTAEGTFAEATQALQKAQTTLGTANTLLGTANNVIQPGSPLHFELVSSLREAKGAMRALKDLAETLERNPDSLFFGRRGSGG